MQPRSSARLVVSVHSRDHAIGPPDAPATLVEYGDYQCPYCAMAHPVVMHLLRQMGPDLRYVFRHFPLSTIHPFALPAAEAAEPAGAQGRFWEMHDILFRHQDRMADLPGLSSALDLDVGRVVDDLVNHVHAPKIRQDFMSGVRSGVNGTPTFFINGVRHDGSYDLASLMEAIEESVGVQPHRR